MWNKWMQLLIGFLCGYLFIKWFPLQFPLHISEMVVEFLFHPIEFLAASVVLIIGFLIHADLLINGTILLFFTFFRKKMMISDQLPSLLVIVNFLVLFALEFWPTIIFFSFSVLYGIISLDFQRLKMLVDD